MAVDTVVHAHLQLVDIDIPRWLWIWPCIPDEARHSPEALHSGVDNYRPSRRDGRTEAETKMDIRSKLTELCEAFNAHNLDWIVAFCADDCVLEMPRGSKPWGFRFEGKRAPPTKG